MYVMVTGSFVIVFVGMLNRLVNSGLTGTYPCIAGAQGRPLRQGG